MYINPIEVPIVYFDKLFYKYQVSEEDLKRYYLLIDIGKEEEAITLFLEEYMVPIINTYNVEMVQFLFDSEKGELKSDARRNLLRNTSLISLGVIGLLNKNFHNFIKKVYSDISFKVNGITNPSVKNIIMESTLSQFEALTQQTLGTTQINILKNIRNMQKEMILFNQMTKGFNKEQLDKATVQFLKKIKNKFPEYQKMKEGKFISSSPYNEKGNVRFYTLENYIKMSVRTTLLNIDRTTVGISILEKERKTNRTPVNVAEFYLADNRTLKTGIERPICKEVLSKTSYGASLVALDMDTAKILGIPLLDDAISAGSFGPYCRHSIKSVSVRMRKKLEKILKEAS